MANNKALIFGITGQDGYYLSHFLVKKEYSVFGTSRSKESISKQKVCKNIKVYVVDILNYNQVEKIIKKVSPKEIYFLSGQSSVSQSLTFPWEAINDNFISLLNIVEAIRKIDLKIKLFNAGSVECFGITKSKININTQMRPANPYGYSKMITFELIKFYRENYNLFACTGILSIHESILRPNTFVLKKIVSEIYKIKMNKSKTLVLGNTNVIRDWGSAEEFVEAFYLMMQQKKPQDYIIGTGISIKLKMLIDYTFSKFSLKTAGHIKIDPSFVRQNENRKIELDVSEIYEKLGWKAKKNAYNIIDEYVNNLN